MHIHPFCQCTLDFLFVGSMIVGPMLVATSDSLAVTPGRAWAPVDTLMLPGYANLAGPRLETTEEGIPLVIGTGWTGTVDNVHGFTWAESTWAHAWQMDRGMTYQWPVLAPAGEIYIVGQEPIADSENKAPFFFAQLVSASFTMEDVTRARSWRDNYTAAVSARRRWVAIADFGGLRAFCSNQEHVWTETPVSGFGDYGMSMAALDDTTVLMAWAGYSEGVRWGQLKETEWTEYPGTLDEDPYKLSASPSFRFRPSGGLWLGWATGRPSVVIRSFRDAAWAPPETLTCAYRSPAYPEMHDSRSFGLSRDGAEYPAVAWSAFDGGTGENVVCVCVPTDSGWTVADQLENDAEGVLPTVARDLNGDVWAAFWRYHTPGIFWTHTYTRAICSRPIASQSSEGRLVRWTLSEPAPETWWAVLRAEGEAPFEPVGRVRATGDIELSWLDGSPVAGDVHYRIRRECVDARYQWLSEVSDDSVPALVSLSSIQAKPGEVTLAWYARTTGAATVYRRTAETEWRELGAPRVEGDGLLTYVDSGLAAGRYAYRLQLGEVITPEAWIDVPSGFALALAGFQPNPAMDPLRVAFSLASDDPATLEVYSVAGRCVLRREVGSLGAGEHLVVLDMGPDLRPGVYWIRLTLSGRLLTTKGVIAE